MKEQSKFIIELMLWRDDSVYDYLGNREKETE